MVPATALKPNVKVYVPPTIVGWCNECEVYVEPYTPGEACPGDHEIAPEGGRASWRPFGFTKRFRKRRVYICRLCYDHECYFTIDAWREHFIDVVENSLDMVERN